MSESQPRESKSSMEDAGQSTAIQAAPMTALVWIPGRRTLHRRDCPIVKDRAIWPYTPGEFPAKGEIAVWTHPKRDWLWRTSRLCRRCNP